MKPEYKKFRKPVAGEKRGSYEKKYKPAPKEPGVEYFNPNEYGNWLSGERKTHWGPTGSGIGRVKLFGK